MGSIDVPAWLQRDRSRRALLGAAERGALLADLAGLDGPELRRVVADNPAVAELVGIAWEAPARTAEDDKRSQLAPGRGRGAARGRRRRGRRPRFLTPTVIALDPARIGVLVIAATLQTEDGELAGIIRREELRARWPGPWDLIAAALAPLQRQGLIRRTCPGPVGRTTRPLTFIRRGQRPCCCSMVAPTGFEPALPP